MRSAETTNEALVLAAEPEPVAEYMDEQDAGVSEGWRIADVGSADWALSRVADLEAEIAENESMAAEAIGRIESRVQALNAKAMRGVAFFRSRLIEFAQTHRDVLLKGGKKKSRELPHGRIAWRSKGGGLQVVDEASLLAWAQAQPVELGLVRIKEEPALKAIKEYAEAKGLIPPGMAEAETVETLAIEAVGPALPANGGK